MHKLGNRLLIIGSDAKEHRICPGIERLGH